MKQLIRNIRLAIRTTACLLSAAALLLASCTQEEVSGGNNDDRPATLALSVVKATDIDVRQVATRAVTTTDYPTSGSIGFFVKEDAANGYAACDNREGKYSTARQLWLPVDSIWLNKHDADIAIYAPYDATHTTPATLNLTAALRPADGSKDIWCKHITANNTSKSPAVTLEHVYSRLYLTVTRDATYKADASLTALAVKGDEIYESATYKPFETTPYTYGTTKGLIPTVMAQTLNASTASAMYDLLLIPTPLTGDITLTLTVDGKKMETIIDKTRFTGSKLEAGKQYNVDLALKPGKLALSSVSVIDWMLAWTAADTPNYTGTPNKEYIELGGVKWAFADLVYNPTHSTYNFPSSAGVSGTKMQWNALTSSDAGNSTKLWDTYSDPCTRIEPKGTWTTPRKEDVDLLLTLPRVWSDNYNGARGWWFGINDAAKAAQSPDRYLFLSAGTGTENYWTQTYGDNQHPVSLSISSAKPEEKDNVAYNTAMKVRCVKRP